MLVTATSNPAVLFVTDEWCAAWGHKPAELQGRELLSLLSPETDVYEVANLRASFTALEPADITVKLNTQQGVTKTARVESMPIISPVTKEASAIKLVSPQLLHWSIALLT